MSRTEWKAFLCSDIWKGFLFEMQEREKYLVELFKDGDLLWNPDTIRGKLTEIEYFRSIPDTIMSSIIIKEANLNNRGDQDELEDEI